MITTKIDEIKTIVKNLPENSIAHKKIEETYNYIQMIEELESSKNILIKKGFQEKDYLIFERYFLKNDKKDLSELIDIFDKVDVDNIPLAPVKFSEILPNNNINPILIKKLWEYKAQPKGIKGVGRSEMFLSLVLNGGESGIVGDVDVFGQPYEVKGVNGRLKGNDKRFRGTFNSAAYINFLEKYSDYVNDSFILLAKKSTDHIFGFSSNNNLCANSLNNILNNTRDLDEINHRDIFIDWFRTVFENMWSYINIDDIDEVARLNGGYYIGGTSDNNKKPSEDFKYITCALNLKLYQEEHKFKGLILTNSSESKGGENLCLIPEKVCQNLEECYRFLKTYCTVAQWESYSNNTVFGITLKKS